MVAYERLHDRSVSVRIKSVKSAGALVRDQRKGLGWSQEELAGKVGVSRLWIGHLEKGKESVEFGLVLRTFRVLGLAMDFAKEEKPRIEWLERGNTGI